MKENKLARDFTSMGLLKFTLPTIIMMMFMSLYTMIDGVFVSRLISTSALSAVNIVYPLINFVIAVGIMLATGGSAIVAVNMGEGNSKEAKENFTFIVAVGIIVGFVITIVGLIFIEPLLSLMGANDAVWQFCYDYTKVLVLFVPLAMLQMLFQFFFVTAGKPTLGLIVTVLGGVANIVLDYVFIAVLDMGIAGASFATGIGYSIPAIFGLIFFFINRKGTLYFVKPKFRRKVLLKACSNGSSEMVTNLSLAIITLMFNLIMMNLIGEDGVAAITIVLYAEYFLVSIFLGYSSGVAPVISYKYGSGDNKGLRHAFRTSMIFIALSSLLMFVAALTLKDSIVRIFAPSDTTVYEIAIRGFFIYSFAFLLKGINIFASSLFTALNNGKVSALLSFLRTFFFIFIALIILPKIMGVDGVWLSVPVAEVFAAGFSAFFIIKCKRDYHYF